jgi:hypothetical protein
VARRLAFFIMVVSLASLNAWAQPENGSYTRLARLSYMEGHVSYQHTSDVDWSAASINLPLEPGDRIYTGRDGRAEIEFDDGSVYRLAENADIEILSLREDLIQLRILVGLSTLTVSSNLDFEVDTPAAAFNAMRKGVYRFDVLENGDTDAIVRKGELEAANNEFTRRIESGEQMHVGLGQSPILAQYNKRDAWDEWNDRRNADMQAYASREYLPDTVYMGISDLDRYGRWVYVGSYGYGWVPFSVDAYWSPYSVGRWCYRPIYGWTWISYEPWGWLPFHYGRWYQSAGFGWCWLPGPAFSFNFWSPGLVSFYSGPGWISWCPLGPGDYYNVAHYHYNRGIYGYQLSRLRALETRAPGDLFNRNAHGAFRTVSVDRFRSGSFHDNRPSSGWSDVRQPWRQGTFVRDHLPIRPTSASFRADPDRTAVRPGTARTLPAVVRNSPVNRGENRGGFTRITNPRIPSLPSRETRSLNNEQSRTLNVGRANTNARAIQRAPANRANSGVRGQSGNNFVEQGDRKTATPRWSGNSSNSGSVSVDIGRSSPTAGRENSVPANPQSTPVPRYRRITPEQNPGPQPAQKSNPRTESPRQNNSNTPRYERTPAEQSPVRRSTPDNNQGYQAPRHDESAVPRSGFSGNGNSSSPGSAAAPMNENFRSFSTSRSYGSSSERYGSENRIFRAPSSDRIGGGNAPSYGRSNGGFSSGRSGSAARNAQRHSGSSGGGRGRR